MFNFGNDSDNELAKAMGGVVPIPESADDANKGALEKGNVRVTSIKTLTGAVPDVIQLKEAIRKVREEDKPKLLHSVNADLINKLDSVEHIGDMLSELPSEKKELLVKLLLKK